MGGCWPVGTAPGVERGVDVVRWCVSRWGSGLMGDETDRLRPASILICVLAVLSTSVHIAAGEWVAAPWSMATATWCFVYYKRVGA